MPAVDCLNGVWQAPEEAKVSIFDRGFMFGDGVYEVIPVYHGKPFTLDRHLARLRGSLDEVKIRHPMTDAEFTSLATEAVERCGESPAVIYIQITRGVAPARSFEYPDVEPTVLVMAWPAAILRRENVVPQDFVTMDDIRWSMGQIKSVSLIAAGMLKNEAMARGVNDAILLRNGHVTEATSSNVFAVIGGKIVTPPKSNFLLHGITRDLVVELCREAGMELEEREITLDELKSADEIMITSSSQEVWPVGSLDGVPVGNGEAGVIWQQVDKLFQDNKARATA